MGKKSAPTAAEKRYMNRVASLNCINHPGTPALIHHMQHGTGTGQRSGNGLIIPLCPECHVGSFSIHKTPVEFQAVWGSELELLNRTIIAASELL